MKKKTKRLMKEILGSILFGLIWSTILIAFLEK